MKTGRNILISAMLALGAAAPAVAVAAAPAAHIVAVSAVPNTWYHQ